MGYLGNRWWLVGLLAGGRSPMSRPADEGGGVAADVGLEYSDHSGALDRGRLMEEVVVDVIGVCQRRGKLPDPERVRELVEREWVGYANARVQTYVPVLIGRAVSSHLLRGG